MMIDKRVVYQLLVGAAMSRTLVDLSAVMSLHFLAADNPRFDELRTQVNDTLLGLLEMDVNAGRLPVSALFVLRQTKLPGPALREAIERHNGSKFQNSDAWKTYWRALVAEIYTQYEFPVNE